MENYNKEVMFDGKVYVVLYQYETDFIEIREKRGNILSDVKLVNLSEVIFLNQLTP